MAHTPFYASIQDLSYSFDILHFCKIFFTSYETAVATLLLGVADIEDMM